MRLIRRIDAAIETVRTLAPVLPLCDRCGSRAEVTEDEDGERLCGICRFEIAYPEKCPICGEAKDACASYCERCDRDND